MSGHMRGTWRRHLLKLAPIAAIALLGILVTAPGASGQAAVDQYVPQSGVQGATGKGSSKPSNHSKTAGTQNGSVAANSTGGTSSGGNLPFTGYPMTPLVWIALAVLVAGALVRITVSVLTRRGLRSSS
jgi:hypothetical protein